MTPTTNHSARRQSRLLPAPDPFLYGWREVPVKRADGSIDYDRKPLTLEDVLHPQFGDVMPQSTPHQRDVHYLADVMERRVADDPTALILQDVIIDWDMLRLRHHSPDIAVIFGVRDAKKSYTHFDVAAEGVRPTVIFEVVSPDYRVNDVETKVDHYYRAGVPWYIIVDRDNVDGPARLIGYRRQPEAYAKMSLDDHERLWLPPLRIWLGVRENRVVCYDGETGKELGNYIRVTQELEKALEAKAKAERAAERAKRRAAKEKKTRIGSDRLARKEKERADQEKNAQTRKRKRRTPR